MHLEKVHLLRIDQHTIFAPLCSNCRTLRQNYTEMRAEASPEGALVDRFVATFGN